MTIASSSNKVIIAGNSATTVFNFSFPYVASGDILVYYTDASGNLSLIPSNQYTLALNAPSGGIWGLGGSVTYNPSSVPIPNGTSLTILRTLPETQATSISNQGASYPQVIETALDYLTMVTQQLQEQINRSILIPVSSTGSPPTFGTPAANAVLIYDATGTIILASSSAFVTATGINNTVIGATTPANGTFTTLSATTLTGAAVGGSVFRQRTFTGTANEITVTNGTGAAGNPTFSLPSALTFTGKTITGGSYTGIAFLGIGVAPSYILDVLNNEAGSSFSVPSAAAQFKNSLQSGASFRDTYGIYVKSSLDNNAASTISLQGIRVLVDVGATSVTPTDMWGVYSQLTASGGNFPNANNDKCVNFYSDITIPNNSSVASLGMHAYFKTTLSNNSSFAGMTLVGIGAFTTTSNCSITNWNGLVIAGFGGTTNCSFTNMASLNIGAPAALDATSSVVNVSAIQIASFNIGTYGTNAVNLWAILYAGGSYFVDYLGYSKHVGMTFVASDFSAAATTSLANVTGLTATLTPGKKYKFKASLHITADGTGGHKYAIGGTTDVTAMVYEIRSLRNDTSALVITARETALATPDGAAGGTSLYTIIEGFIQASTNGGTVTVQFAQNAASGTSKVLAGSTFEVERIAA